jgi:hypothetical protein
VRASITVLMPETPAADEEQAPGGTPSEAVPLLHSSRQGSRIRARERPLTSEGSSVMLGAP